MNGSWILSGILALPLIGALFILLLPGDSEATKRNARWIALFTTLLTFLLSLVAWGHFDPAQPGFQLVEERDWFSHAILYKLGVDGVSMPFVLLTTFIMPICIIASWAPIQTRVKEYMVVFLVMETLMVGVFVALDLVLFYLSSKAASSRCLSSSASGATGTGCTRPLSSSSTPSPARC